MLDTMSLSATKPPAAFVCTSTKKVMRDPVLALCGHLFDSHVIAEIEACPVDGNNLLQKGYTMPLPQLKGRIEKWNASKKEEKIRPSKVKLEDKRVLKNVHQDDIHGLIPLGNDLFISGSKDTTCKIWNAKSGKVVKIIDRRVKKNYSEWITSLASYDANYWVYGTRDGLLSFNDREGNSIKSFRYNPGSFKSKYQCKGRNKARINCIVPAPGKGNPLACYVGTPRYIHYFNGKTIASSITASQNDWVYCFSLLSENRAAIVIGSDLEIWENFHGNRELTRTTVLTDTTHQRGNERPHISAIKQQEGKPNTLLTSLFKGWVKVVDLQQETVVRSYHEHKGRVWMVENLFRGVFATGADDKTMKLWDVRAKKSFKTISKQPGRVSSLLRLNDHTLISGSCPDNVWHTKSKASITYWDFRKL